ncbi:MULTISPECIES: hypothetical protein [Trichocoleus]|uniref:Uncharacterized protein n=1 Tax=Trichocoleus desertorum GB2-A4 TaxID=2933944 RepID=A0ABV0JGD9_9CYAN|nr:hypothetical protein [Trichocoleus sp. FACHB-46]MBD1864573.1 hypothetical protein [Trichocoleus sp. FACHB-46]
MRLQNSQLLLFTSFLTLFCGGGALLFFLYFGTALSQEDDTPDILRSALQMELTHADITAVKSNPKRLLVRSFSALKTHLEQRGWTWVDQMGSLVVYRQAAQQLNANCAMYSRSYMLCDLSEVP